MADTANTNGQMVGPTCGSASAAGSEAGGVGVSLAGGVVGSSADGAVVDSVAEPSAVRARRSAELPYPPNRSAPPATISDNVRPS